VQEDRRAWTLRAEGAMGLVLPEPLPAGGASRAGVAGGSGAVAYLLDAVRLRPGGRRILSAVAVVLVLGGVALFAFPLGTDLYATEVLQERLEEQLTEQGLTTTAAPGTYDPAAVATGEPLTRIVLPRIGVSAIVVQGTSMSALRAGAGHHPTTPLPGEPGNVAIAGHRTTFGQPFNRLDELQVGDEIRLETPIATHVYRVSPRPPEAAGGCANGACWITGPRDWGVVGPTDRASLTLTTCHPKGSAQQRLILRAELAQTLPPPPVG